MGEDMTKGTKERSALYPAIALDECIEFIGIINKLGGRKVALLSVAEAVGVSTTTYSFKAKVSSCQRRVTSAVATPKHSPCLLRYKSILSTFYLLNYEYILFVIYFSYFSQ